MARSNPSSVRPRARAGKPARTSGARFRALGKTLPELTEVLEPLDRQPWVRKLEIAHQAPPIFQVAGDGERCIEMEVAGAKVWLRVSWDADGDPLRADFVDSVLELARARVRSIGEHEEAERRGEDVLRARRARIDLEMELGAAAAIARVAAERAKSAEARSEQAERMLVEQERFTAMSAMCASVAHDIRSPLTALVWNLRVLEEKTRAVSGADVEMGELFQDTKLACDLIEGVLDGLRTFATGSGAPRSFDAHHVVVSTVRLFRWHVAQRGVRFKQRIDEDLVAWGTPSEVCQILLNLLANAADASPRGGTVRLEALRDGEQVVVRVSDEGRGIDPADVETVFEPFHSTKEGGLGIGLTVARAMARRHGGDIHVVPRPAGDGACLELRLRATDPKSA